MTERPYTICHMLSAIDGKIAGEFFRMPELSPTSAAYGEIRAKLNCTATLCGAVTAAEIYGCGRKETAAPASSVLPRATYVADSTAQHFAVVVDTEGRLRWNSGTVNRAGQPESHVIVVLSENVPDAHLEHLRQQGVSYLFAGKEQLEAERAVRELKSAFHIETLLIIGGGVVNWTFLQAGLIDELSLVICPLADGRIDTARVFDRSGYLDRNVPVAFSLLEIQKLEGSGIWLRYRPQNVKN